MSVTHLIDKINAMAETLPSLEESERRQLLQACDKLKNKFESPFELASRLVFSGHQAIALRLGIDLKLFDVIAAQAGQCDASVNVSKLAEETGAEPLLIVRIMRFLAAMSVVKEVCPGSYISTPLAAALVSSSPLSAAMIHGTHFMTVLSRLPEYFRTQRWESPNDAFNGPFQFAIDSPHYFEFLNSSPYYQQAFNTTMTMSFRRRGKDWFDIFPVADRLRVPGDADPLLVDIGGGQGEDLKKFKARFPTLPGKLFLQDLPAVVQGAQDLPAGIEVQNHDFFLEQPVKNAKVYFMRTVLHDWPDKQAGQILSRARDAMDLDSILLISETMLPESGALLSSVISDMQMMGSFASMERTEAQWRALLEQNGLELVHTWLPNECDGSAESLAEQPALFEARKG
ncbi:uncharacterized protein N7484_009935 [Penicillium longicatenatum]|uniref:uncharacterized protein n=1 Tax=Penicillium longicatenatum TaxID=1561947 RepID=UPI002547D6DD|nr:uncharacterized protein N7484_009935 [Penicillium longicatenatum]KAJ5636622.1 hypothetical protein N7484_009935 [Penicillium longicatenatum]